MNRLPLAKRAQILGLLVEGTSLRATSRLADVSINTVTKLLVDVGMACAAYQDQAFRSLTCQRIQVDEIWSFVYAKQRSLPTAKAAPIGSGDVWTWTAIDPDTKLVPSWLVSDRTQEAAIEFLSDLHSRMANRIQLSSDGHTAYAGAVDIVFKGDVDFGQLIKTYRQTSEGQRRYSPPRCTGARREAVEGNPDMRQVSTSISERQNLTMRMSMRRFTRLTNGFSKKVENHAHAIALHFMFYNFGRIHKSLRVTPAMQAGVADHVWSLEEIAELA
jgi:IS1 family transposase